MRRHNHRALIALLSGAALMAQAGGADEPAPAQTTGQKIDSSIDEATEAVGELWQKTQESTSELLDKTAEVSGNAWEATKAAAGQAAEDTKQLSREAWKATKRGAAKAGAAVEHGYDVTKDKVKEVVP